MDIRIDGLHEKALLRLMERNNEKTGVGMARILIRDAARDAGLWPAIPNESDNVRAEASSDVTVTELAAEPA